jgi:short-chain fatty acids transporter
MIIAWLNWGLSLIASAMLALFIVRRNPKVDYRLVAAAYLGWVAPALRSFRFSYSVGGYPDNFLIKGSY